MLKLQEINGENIFQFLNLRDLEVLSFYNTKSHIIDTAENFDEIAEKVSTGTAIVFPYVDELYSYNRAMFDFLVENNIAVSDCMSATEELQKRGEDETFREFWRSNLCSKFEQWCRKNLIQNEERRK